MTEFDYSTDYELEGHFYVETFVGVDDGIVAEGEFGENLHVFYVEDSVVLGGRRGGGGG